MKICEWISDSGEVTQDGLGKQMRNIGMYEQSYDEDVRKY